MLREIVGLGLWDAPVCWAERCFYGPWSLFGGFFSWKASGAHVFGVLGSVV